MTDKQIIIDGVDVSGCCHYNKKTGICSNGFRADEIPYCNCFTCNYKRWKVAEKQLKRKEQECEELRGDLYFTNEQLKDFKSHYDKAVEECENLREKYLGLKEQKGSYIVQLNTVNDQLDQLKEENEYNEANAIEFKQTLTEIKEIAQYDVYTTRTDLCLKLNWIKKKISEVEND